MIKKLLKRIFCKHEYKRTNEISGRNTETGKWEVLVVSYECVKCGKELHLSIYDK